MSTTTLKFFSKASFVLALFVSFTSQADIMVYPAKGQDSATQQQDQGECFIWAKNQTGIDPMNPVSAAAPQAPKQQGRAIGGAAKGAILGGIVDGSDGAKTGAAVGAVSGRMRQNSSNRANSQQAQQSAEQANQINAQNKATFDRAYGVCLQGRGYTVG
jgi:FAD/FMN-containing dehydrogenase